VKESRRIASQNDVSHIKNENQNVGTSAKDRFGGIRSATNKTRRQKKIAETVEPSLGSLLQIIYGFLKFADIMRIIRLNKTTRLSHIDLLSEISI